MSKSSGGTRGASGGAGGGAMGQPERNVRYSDVMRQVQMLNPKVSTISSMGSFVTNEARQLSEYVAKEMLPYVSKGSLAERIINQNMGEHFSEKQMGVIARELHSNPKYVSNLGKELQKIEAHEAYKRAKRAAKRREKADKKKQLAESIKKTEKAIAQRTVEHATFGKGRVISEDAKTVTVRFDTAGEKKLLKAFAKFK